jgi:hypothetical protein
MVMLQVLQDRSTHRILPDNKHPTQAFILDMNARSGNRRGRQAQRMLLD